jgi:hypothetical protein
VASSKGTPHPTLHTGPLSTGKVGSLVDWIPWRGRHANVSTFEWAKVGVLHVRSIQFRLEPRRGGRKRQADRSFNGGFTSDDVETVNFPWDSKLHPYVYPTQWRGFQGGWRARRAALPTPRSRDAAVSVRDGCWIARGSRSMARRYPSMTGRSSKPRDASFEKATRRKHCRSADPLSSSAGAPPARPRPMREGGPFRARG